MEDEVEFEVEVTRELVTKLAISLYPTPSLATKNFVLAKCDAVRDRARRTERGAGGANV